VGSTTTDLSFDDLINENHAIALLEFDEDDVQVSTGGEIGGTDDGDGVLMIGLREARDSGFS